MNIRLLDLKAQHEPIRIQIMDALAKAVEGNAFILGPQVKELENYIASYSNIRFAIDVSSDVSTATRQLSKNAELTGFNGKVVWDERA